jgi:antagonist of KipI
LTRLLRVLSPGLLTTVQDLGRPRAGSSGVPPGGALDDEALRVANLLVGNAPDAAGLEVWFRGPRLAASSEVALAVAGGPFGPAPGRLLFLEAGEEIEILPEGPASRCVVAAAGGIDVPRVLGSRSTLLSAGFGGLSGRPLRAGDELPLGEPARPPGPSAKNAASLPEGILGEEGAEVVLGVGPGADRSLFGEEALRTFFSSAWTLLPESNREGFRLGGSLVVPRDRGGSPSLPTFPGLVQVTRNGMPMVLMAEGPVTGGYPQLGALSRVDLRRLVRVRPFQRIRFVPVTWDEAAGRRAVRRARIDAWERSLGRST